MDAKEIKRLQDYVKKRYDEVSMDYQTFSGDIDTDLSFSENKRIIDEQLNVLLPKVMTAREIKETTIRNQELVKEQEQARAEEEARQKFDEQLQKISQTPHSYLLDKLYYVPRQFIKMVLEKKSKGLLLYGEAGLGKSFNVKKQLAEHNLKEGKDFNFVTGHITTMSFYKKLYNNKDRLLILDDINILESKINLNMLKASLSQEGLVEYTSSALKDVPSQFQFTGQIIILLNDKPKNSEHLKAVESRILTYELEMDYQTKLTILYDIAKVDYEGTTLEDRQNIASWIKSNTNEATKNLSIRLLFTMFEFFKFDTENWTRLGLSYIQNDEYTTLIIQGLNDKQFCEKTGLHRATYYRLKQKVAKSHNFDMSVKK